MHGHADIEGILLLLYETVNVTRAFERDLVMNIRITPFEISTSALVLTFDICGCCTYWVLNVQYNSTYPEACYPDRLAPSDKSVENSTKLTRHEVSGYRIK